MVMAKINVTKWCYYNVPDELTEFRNSFVNEFNILTNE